MSSKGTPPYPDLGKLARDLLRRGYHPGIWQIDCKTLTSSGIEFFTTGFASQDNSKVKGSLQSKYKIEDHGLTLTERWNTENWLFGEIMQKDKLAEGLMLALEAKFQPGSNEGDGKFKLGYAKDNFHFLADIGLNSEPALNCSLVLSHNEFLGGLGGELDVSNVDLKMWKVALGWTNETATLHGELKNGDTWLASLFYKASEKIDVGAEITKTGGQQGEGGEQQEGGDLVVSLGMLYHLEENALIRAKINNVVELGLGYEQKLRDGITASISAVLDCGNISDGNHKFGVGVALQC
ncbi:voltage-dependent anion-selective channel [Drosophila bipectinata]|uniref:voltage-dependent anion-selective channel n=1 Tax=Drosophila bipectinata TaxID=42026 RepID=UPI001C899ED5|nr:voltage-dependent anion-selective channel [Drosophila bipectinata]